MSAENKERLFVQQKVCNDIASVKKYHFSLMSFND